MAEQKQQAAENGGRERTFLYTLGRSLFWIWFHTFCPVVYHGYDPSLWQGKAILISNHKTFADPLAVSIPIRGREVHWIGKKELAKVKLFQKVLTGLHVILIGRGETDMAAMRQCMKALQEGHILGIFPEGTRHQEKLMEKVESGAAFIALRSGARMVPVYICGKLRPFHINHVVYGTPVETEDLRRDGINSENVNRLCERIRSTFYQMREDTEKKFSKK